MLTPIFNVETGAGGTPTPVPPSGTRGWGELTTLDFTTLPSADWTTGGPYAVNSTDVHIIRGTAATALGPDGSGLFLDQTNPTASTDIFNANVSSPGIEVALSDIWADYSTDDTVAVLIDMEAVTDFSTQFARMLTGIVDSTLTNSSYGTFIVHGWTASGRRDQPWLRQPSTQATGTERNPGGFCQQLQIIKRGLSYGYMRSTSPATGTPIPEDAGTDGLTWITQRLAYGSAISVDPPWGAWSGNDRFGFYFHRSSQNSLQLRIKKLHFYRYGVA